MSAGCSDSSAEQAKSKQAAKPVKTEAVRQESVRRSLDVVGTLAAEDQVTVSSEVEGVVRRVLADLGDRVTSGQPLVELDREKLQYSLDQQRAAHERSLGKYGASDAEQLPRIEDTPDVRRASAELAQAKQAFARATELHKRQLIAQQMLDDADTALRLKAAAYDAALQEAKNLRADIDASAATMKLAERHAGGRIHPRAVRRLCPAADGLARRAGESADAGHDRRAREPAEAALRDSRAHGAMDQSRTAVDAERRCFP